MNGAKCQNSGFAKTNILKLFKSIISEIVCLFQLFQINQFNVKQPNRRKLCTCIHNTNMMVEKQLYKSFLTKV